MAKKFSLLFLFSKISASAAVVHALKAKGLDVIAIDNHKDLINMINSRTVDLIGLSVNHANEGAIAQVLKSNNIPFFNFAEDGAAATIVKLNSGHAELKIPGVVSSYTVWMQIASFVKEKTEASGGKVIVFGAKDKKDSIGSVSVTVSPERETPEGAITLLETSIAATSGGTLTLLEEEEMRLGRISTPVSKRFQESLLQTLAPWRGRLLSSDDKKFPPLYKIKVVPVRNESEKGLLIFCGDVETPADHINTLKERICQDMQSPSFECGDLFEFDIPVDDISQWTYANCLFSFTYQGTDRFMVSYLKRSSILPNFVRTENMEMYGVNIADLPPQPSLDFDLFLYFNRNEKMVPYIKKGDSINQDKLQSRGGIKVLYFKNEDQNKLNRIFIEASLKAIFGKAKAKSQSL